MRLLLIGSTFFTLVAFGNRLDSLKAKFDQDPSFEIADQTRLEGFEYKKASEYDLAEAYYLAASRMFSSLGDSVSLAKTCNHLGLLYRSTGQYEASLKYFYQAVELNQAIGSSYGLINNYINLGNHYNNQENFERAINYFLEAQREIERSGKSSRAKYLYSSIANLYINKSYRAYNLDSALLYFHRSLSEFKEDGDTLNIAIAYNNIAAAYDSKGMSGKALEMYLEAIKLKEVVNDKSGLAVSYNNLAKNYLEKRNLEASERYFWKALEIASALNDNELLASIYTSLIQLYILAGDTEQASGLMSTYDDFRDEVYDRQKMSRLREVEAMYEVEKTNRELSWQRKLTSVKQRQVLILGILVVVLLVFIALAIQFFRQRQAAQKKLRAEEINTLKKDQEVLELNAMIHGQEEERNRIATDLHDRLGARLSTIKLLLQDDVLEQRRDKLLDFINESIKETREISHNLSSDMLNRFGLKIALSDMVYSISNDKIQGHFQFHGKKERLDLKLERNIYYIALELINNTLKHAEATEFSLQIIHDEEELNLIYEDNGIGFELTEKEKGLGMQNLKSRAAIINGTITIDSMPGQGVNVVLSIPLRDQLEPVSV